MKLDPEFTTTDVPEELIYMTTSRGCKFHHFQPDPQAMKIEDVARALSNNCRFNGHTPFHYSVAQHSLHCEELLGRLFPEASKAERRTALMHDCAEAWLPDVHSLVKHKFPNYMRALRKIEEVSAECFNLIWPEPAKVKLVDGILLSTELVYLMRARPHKHQPLTDFRINKMDPTEVEVQFLARWDQLK